MAPLIAVPAMAQSAPAALTLPPTAAATEPASPPAFALEMDHFADCVRNDRRPYSTGEDGLQDQRIVEAIYASARANGQPIALRQPEGLLRGPEPVL